MVPTLTEDMYVSGDGVAERVGKKALKVTGVRVVGDRGVAMELELGGKDKGEDMGFGGQLGIWGFNKGLVGGS